MNVFVDTSALVALLDTSNVQHVQAKETYRRILEEDTGLLTSSYIMVETMAVVQRRLGDVVLHDFLDATEGIFQMVWIYADIHQGALRWFRERKDKVSFVDLTSFLVMKEYGIQTAFAFDRDFEREGFQILSV